MKELIRQSRLAKGFTQEETAKRMYMTTRNYQNIEYGGPMNPDQAVRLGDILECPQITMAYCRQSCAVGKKYCFELLNNVDLSPMAILAKYRQEEGEAHEALEHMLVLMLNKRGAGDCSEEELAELWRWSLEMLDLEHVIETLKLRLWDFLDVAKLIKAHNQKCLEKHYVDPAKPELQLAG